MIAPLLLRLRTELKGDAAELRRTFALLDADGSGSISVDEFEQALAGLG